MNHSYVISRIKVVLLEVHMPHFGLNWTFLKFKMCNDCAIEGFQQLKMVLKPILHCDTKPLGLGPGVGLDPQRHNLVLGIPPG